MYLIAWVKTTTWNSESETIKNWEVVDGEDAMQIRVSELIDEGVREKDIVVGEITENTR